MDLNKLKYIQLNEENKLNLLQKGRKYIDQSKDKLDNVSDQAKEKMSDFASSAKDKLDDVDQPYTKAGLGLGAAYMAGKHLKNRKKGNTGDNYRQSSEDLVDLMPHQVK